MAMGSTTDEGDGRPEAAGVADRVVAEIELALAGDNLELPTLPDAPLRVWAALEGKDPEIRDIVAAMESDPALAARLLRLANSVAYFGSRSVDNLHDTVVRVGLLGVRRVVLAIMVAQLYSSRGHPLEPLLAEAWEWSTLVASLSRRLAAQAPRLDEGVALLAGLVHNVGVLPIIDFAERHPRLCEDRQELARVIARMQAPVGAMVAQRWGFPATLADVIAHLQDPDYAPRDTDDYVGVVRAAVALAELSRTGALVAGEDGVGDVTLLDTTWSGADARVLAEQGEEEARLLRLALADLPANP